MRVVADLSGAALVDALSALQERAGSRAAREELGALRAAALRPLAQLLHVSVLLEAPLITAGVFSHLHLD